MSSAGFAALFVFAAVCSLPGSELAQITPADTSAPSPEPNAADQQAMLDRMRQYATEYIGKLPDFICQQTTAQFEAGTKSNPRWHKGDILTVRLVFSQGREQRQLQLVNRKAPEKGGRGWRTPLVTEGEFGVLLGNVFDPATEAKFTWDRWEMVRSKRLAVFTFSVDAAHSRLSLSLSDLAHAIVPYHGSVAADPETGAIWRIVSGTSEIPKEVRTRSIRTTIDYSEVAIGGRTYLLPIEAEVYMLTDSAQIRNDLAFEGYRKFEAESTITFSADEAAAPHP